MPLRARWFTYFVSRRKTLHSDARIKLTPTAVILTLVTFACAFAVCYADKPQNKKPADKKPNSNTNTLCYVCHLDLQTELITTVHLSAAVTCDKCHGPSASHMHDEMLMTKPDILYGRQEVDKMCSRCHQPHKNPDAVEAFRKEWSGRTRPNGRAVTEESVCTDCHGTHNIVKKMPTASDKQQSSDWIALFNGSNLDNWRVSGKARWTVERSSIIAKPGSKGRGGDLWTRQTFTDYLLAVTFRATWPIHAGIWLRGADGPRIEIFENPQSTAFSGSVRVPGKALVLKNMHQDLFDPETWNTISVKVQRDRLQVWLNGEEVGAVRISGPAKGKLGLHLEKHPRHKTAELCVREVLVQPMGEPSEKATTTSKD
jgi:hypothetical protein